MTDIETAGGAHAHPPLDRLDDYVDGALAAADGAAVERHVAACAGCRRDVDGLRRLRAAAGALPRSMEPPAEVWTAVRARMRDREVTLRARRAWWRRAPALAAAAAVLLVASARLVATRSAAPPAGRGAAAAARPAPAPPTTGGIPVSAPVARQLLALERAATELESAVAARAVALSPEARASLARGLGVVDTAIAEARAALARDPADPAVTDALTAMQERRVELLRQATRTLSED